MMNLRVGVGIRRRLPERERYSMVVDLWRDAHQGIAVSGAKTPYTCRETRSDRYETGERAM